MDNILEILELVLSILAKLGASKPDFDQMWADAQKSIERIDADVKADEAEENAILSSNR